MTSRLSPVAISLALLLGNASAPLVTTVGVLVDLVPVALAVAVVFDVVVPFEFTARTPPPTVSGCVTVALVVFMAPMAYAASELPDAGQFTQPTMP